MGWKRCFCSLETFELFHLLSKLRISFASSKLVMHFRAVRDGFQRKGRHQGGETLKVQACRALGDVLFLSSVKQFSSGNSSLGKLLTSCTKT